MKTISIRGKEYVPVVERVKEFHKLHPNGTISTEIIDSSQGRIVVKATVYPDGNLYNSDGSNISVLPSKSFTGHSQAEWSVGMMGAVALEVAETSAIGRALGFANIGLIDGIASADEMRKAGADHSEPTTPSMTAQEALGKAKEAISDCDSIPQLEHVRGLIKASKNIPDRRSQEGKDMRDELEQLATDKHFELAKLEEAFEDMQ